MCSASIMAPQRGVHMDSSRSCTFELTVADCVLGWTSNLNGAQPATGRPRHWRPMAASAQCARLMRAFVQAVTAMAPALYLLQPPRPQYLSLFFA